MDQQKTQKSLPVARNSDFSTMFVFFCPALSSGGLGAGLQDTASANFATTLAELARPFTLTLLGHQPLNVHNMRDSQKSKLIKHAELQLLERLPLGLDFFGH